ncbi:MAG TPA: hypothetical protein VFT79_11515 [Solirubrobacterales bacterium]|nr:hypothetical protein [Solirubrobacterales bacterium]
MKGFSLALAAVLCLLACSSPESLGAALPEGRAYEQVSLADKNGGDVGGPLLEGAFGHALGQSASDANSILYASFSSFADAQSAELFTYYISTRGDAGWSTHAISPPPADPPRLLENPPFRAFAADLSGAVLEWGKPTLAPEAPADYENLYVGAPGDYAAVGEAVPPNRLPDSFRLTFAGATADLSRIVFEANDALLPEAPAEASSVYEWSAASGLRLVSVLPEGEAAPSASAASAFGSDFDKVISADGSRVFWTAEGQLYVREGGVRTVKLNTSRRAVSLGDGSAELLAISADGSKAFFSDSTSLTDALDDHGGLYEYDLEGESLRLLTPEPGGEPRVEGVVAAAADGSAVYFVARSALAAGAQDGEPNLYLARAGTLELIGTLANGDSSDWTSWSEERTSRLSADGEQLAFLSRISLTGYDNRNAVTGDPVSELFVYDAGEDRLTCVSCNPTGARPIGRATLPGNTFSTYQSKIFSADGSRVFFNSADALVLRDSNHRQDVYLFADGEPQLISTGTSDDISALVDVGGGGRDVFFTTRSRLVAADRDNGSDLYDARMGGGFPEEPEPLPCEGEACRGPLGAAHQPAPFPATALPGPEAESRVKRHHRKRCRRHHGKARSRSAAAAPRRCRRGR